MREEIEKVLEAMRKDYIRWSDSSKLFNRERSRLNDEMIELKGIYKELKGELKGNIENEKIINAMIQNYRMRLEILETLLEQLNSLEKEDNLSKNRACYSRV